MILVDTNVIMYAAGAEHPHKAASVAFLREVADGAADAAVDAEVMQEILHRYRSIRRWAEGRRVYDLTRAIFPIVIPITAEVLDRARRLLDGHDHLLARDALHASVALTQNLDGIVSFDRDLDGIAGVTRREP